MGIQRPEGYGLTLNKAATPSGGRTRMQKNENIKEDDRHQNESFQAEKMRRRKGLSRDQTENISMGVTTWRQTMKTQQLQAGAKQPMKSSVTKAGCPFLSGGSLLSLPCPGRVPQPSRRSSREGSICSDQSWAGGREVRACGGGLVSFWWMFAGNKELAEELNE